MGCTPAPRAVSPGLCSVSTAPVARLVGCVCRHRAGRHVWAGCSAQPVFFLMQRLKTRPQFQATLNGGMVARTPHFALHRLMLGPVAAPEVPEPVSEQASAAGGLAQLAYAPSEMPVDTVTALAQQVSAAPLIAPGSVWLGAMVPKRWARRAVTRNAIKRQIYGVAVNFEARLPAASHVVRLRATFDRKQFVSASSEHLKAAVRQELHALFERASRKAVA